MPVWRATARSHEGFVTNLRYDSLMPSTCAISREVAPLRSSGQHHALLLFLHPPMACRSTRSSCSTRSSGWSSRLSGDSEPGGERLRRHPTCWR
jgi:hypothetical protein